MTIESDGLAFSAGPSSRTNRSHLSFPARTAVSYDPTTWERTLVMVQHGVLRLTCPTGRVADFAAGSIVYLAGLSLATIGAGSSEPVTLHLLSPPSAGRADRCATSEPPTTSIDPRGPAEATKNDITRHAATTTATPAAS